MSFQFKQLVVLVFAATAAFSSCNELQSDEELREDIIGTWRKVDCSANFRDGSEVIASSLLEDKMIFQASGSLAESGVYAYCCVNACDTSTQGYCSWVIKNGALTIVPDQFSDWAHLNQPYPILRLTKNQLAFDNVIISGLVRKKTCYCRE